MQTEESGQAAGSPLPGTQMTTPGVTTQAESRQTIQGAMLPTGQSTSAAVM